MKKKTTKKASTKLNARERAIVLVLRKLGKADLDPISRAAFLDDDRKGPRAQSYFRANSWARNAVRRPLRDGIVRRVGASGSGMYAITAKGREVRL